MWSFAFFLNEGAENLTLKSLEWKYNIRLLRITLHIVFLLTAAHLSGIYSPIVWCYLLVVYNEYICVWRESQRWIKNRVAEIQRESFYFKKRGACDLLPAPFVFWPRPQKLVLTRITIHIVFLWTAAHHLSGLYSEIVLCYLFVVWDEYLWSERKRCDEISDRAEVWKHESWLSGISNGCRCESCVFYASNSFY
jgi:hypothetical protein